MVEDKLASEIGFEADTTMASTGHAPCDNIETHPPPISSAIQAPCNDAKLRCPAMVGPPAMRWIPIMPHGKFLALGDAAVANKIGSHTQLMLEQIRSQTVLGTTSETLQKGHVCPPNIYSGGNNYYENMSGENALGKDYEVSKIACGENEKDKIMPVESSVHHLEIGEHRKLEREKGLNKTPQQKPKKKKIRPKVIREDKPVRTPKSETIPATKKQKNRSETPAKPNTSETPATKKQINTSETTATKKQINSSETPTTTTPPNHSVTRTYVRRKKLQQSSDVPTSSSGEILDLENESGRKAVKRRLYFNSTEPQARDESQGSKLMYTSNEAQVHDVSLSSNVPSSNFKSAENREKSAEGSTFSLDTLMDQMPTVNILPPKTPIPASHPSKRRSTRVNTEPVGNKRAARAPPSLLQPSRRELIRENLKELSKKNGFLQVSGNTEKSTVTTQLDSTMTSDVPFRGIKRGYSLVGENSIPGYRGFMCTSDSDRMGYITGTNGYSHGPYFPKIYKKKRTQKGMKLMPNHSLQGTCSGSSNSSSSNSGSSNWRTNQFLVAFETQRAFWMQRVLFNQRETMPKNTLDLPAQTSSLISPGESVPSKLSEISNITCNQFSAPEMDNTQRSKNYVRQYSYLNWKTKKRTKKEHIRLARSGSSYTNQIPLQEHQAASFNYGFHGKRSVHITAEISETSKYKNPSLRVANTVQEPFCGRRVKEPFCGVPAASQRVRYEDLLDLIILRMKHLNLYEINVINTAATQNALVPYNAGGGMLIPYEGQLNLAKKQRPRPKVDLDPETNRVWNLLMGKESEEHEVDADKEKWWEEERKVVRGRVDSFIARMHLVQGDRRFSKWKGSVVDSVVGVFLTQNVSDHLSSSAFMALAAKYPCRPKVNSNTCDIEISSTSAVQQEMSSIYSYENLKCQEKMLDQELCYQVTLEEEPVTDKEMANNNESFGSNNGTIVLDYSNDKDTDFHVKESEVGQQSPDSMTSIAVEVTSMTSIAAGVTENVGALESSVTLSQNSSEYIIQSIDPKKSVPLVDMEDLISDDLHLIDSSTPFMELLQMQGSTSFKELYSNVAGSIPPAEYCDTTDQMAYSSVQQDTYNLMGVSYAPSTSYKLQSCSMPSAASSINTTYNDVIGRPASESSGEGTNHQMLSTTSRTSPPIDTYEQLSSQLMQPLTCSETLISKESSESSNLQSLQSDQTARLQQKEVAEKIQVEITEDAAKIQDQTRNGGVPETYLNLNKDLAETVEVVEGLKSTTEDDVHSVKNDSTSTKKHSSKPSKAKTETQDENFDWDKLRRQACPNGTKVERSSDTMDSLDWDALRCADVDEISETIRDRGMNNVLSSRIKAFLNRLVKDHGSIDLEWLRDVPPESAKDYLLSIRGLGLKSAECVRLLTLHQLAFPVDTNVGRICVRLGWVPLQPLPESLQLHLLELYPVLETIQKYLWPRLCKLDQQTLYELHYQMITFGKVFCTKRQPNCNACPMRAECRHFASAFTSARLLLTGPEEKGLVNTTFPNTPGTSQTPETCQTRVCTQKVVPQLEGISSSRETTVCEPIIEEPSTPEPEPETVEDLIREIEDDFREDSEGSPRVREIEDDSHVDSEEIPHIRLDLETLTQNIQDYMQTNKMEVADGEMSNALVVLTQEAASIPVPKLKNQRRLRTEHLVYELPDSHPLLEGYDPREPDDPSPYLLAIWSPGETAHSFEPTKTRCDSQNGELCENSTCFACNGIREARSQTVRGTLLIPCRTANKGSFPLNGTYFQVNEVFAEHESSLNPLVVPRQWLGNLRRRTVFFGTSTTSIFKGLTTDEIMLCFWKGYVCIRGVERKTGFPRPLYARLHLAASKAKNVKAAAEAAEAAAMAAASAKARNEW